MNWFTLSPDSLKSPLPGSRDSALSWFFFLALVLASFTNILSVNIPAFGHSPVFLPCPHLLILHTLSEQSHRLNVLAIPVCWGLPNYTLSHLSLEFEAQISKCLLVIFPLCLIYASKINISNIGSSISSPDLRLLVISYLIAIPSALSPKLVQVRSLMWAPAWS